MAQMRVLVSEQAGKLQELASLPMSVQEAQAAREAAEALVAEQEATVGSRSFGFGGKERRQTYTHLCKGKENSISSHSIPSIIILYL